MWPSRAYSGLARQPRHRHCCVTPDSAHLVRDEARVAGERVILNDGLLVRDEVKYLCSWTRSKSWEKAMVMDVGQGHAHAQGHRQ